MTVYTVHARGSVLPQVDPLGLVFVKEGFSWPALFFAVPWMLFRMMWLVLLLYLIAVAGLFFLGKVVPPQGVVVAAILFGLLFALEANELRRWKLSRAGYRLVGVAEGRNRVEAEARYFTALPPITVALAKPPAPPSPPPPPAETGHPVGLFPNPGGAG